jgi:DNA polymerase III epsilon subunit family exonuclease
VPGQRVSTEARQPKQGRASRRLPTHLLYGMPFAVVDVETTGFSPRLGDRIIEIAILRVAEDGAVEDEWSTLVNPLRDVGPTNVHGITPEDVALAPTFTEILGDVVKRLDQAVFVAHNDQFDHEFLATEFSMAGIFLPATPSLCTLRLAYRLYPGLTNHQLLTCCEAAGLAIDGGHAALEDAHATARLVLVLLDKARAVGLTTLLALGCSPDTFPAEWPRLKVSGRHCKRGARATPEVPFLARMVASLGPVKISGERVAPYLDLLDRALEDRFVTEEEAQALQAVAEDWGLSREEIIGAHHSYLESMIAAALADGRITESERRDLTDVGGLLSIDGGMLKAMMRKARRARDTGPVLRPIGG